MGERRRDEQHADGRVQRGVCLREPRHRDDGAEGVADTETRQPREAATEFLLAGGEVTGLASPRVVASLAAAGAAEVEAERGAAQLDRGRGGGVHDVVVHVAAVERVGVRDGGDEGRRRFWFDQCGFQRPGGALEFERRDSRHRLTVRAVGSAEYTALRRGLPPAKPEAAPRRVARPLKHRR